jgi:hypothetical protein
MYIQQICCAFEAPLSTIPADLSTMLSKTVHVAAEKTIRTLTKIYGKLERKRALEI